MAAGTESILQILILSDKPCLPSTPQKSWPQSSTFSVSRLDKQEETRQGLAGTEVPQGRTRVCVYPSDVGPLWGRARGGQSSTPVPPFPLPFPVFLHGLYCCDGNGDRTPHRWYPARKARINFKLKHWLYWTWGMGDLCGIGHEVHSGWRCS